jgi:hypothetical protein
VPKVAASDWKNASGAIGAPVFGREKVSIFLIARGGVAIYAAKRVAVSSKKVSKR